MGKALSSPSSSNENLLTVEREEVMVSDKGRCLRKSYFLKPNAKTSADGSVSELPRRDHCLSVYSSQLSFSGFWLADCRFLTWLRKMEALHEPIWRKAGIFEAIKVSTYNISQNHPLILSITEKWCSRTKSFVFPWGEATITLEDVFILLRLSVLGSPLFASLESSEMRDSVEKLHNARKECSSYRHTSPISWFSSFFGRGDEMEHEAFLALWLSLFVFPGTSRPLISRHVIPIAVRLARGERIALAPAVLAFLYKDLGQIHEEQCGDKVTLRSLFKLVQVWTWERFKSTSPIPRDIPIGEPRISRWSGLKQKSEDVSLSFNDFEWRPYTKPLHNWSPLQFYVEEAMWITVDNSLDDEFTSFARCVRSSQLVADDFVEAYFPDRVAMQFGLDQDIPGLVTRNSDFTVKEAWDDYNKSLDGLLLYIPARLNQGYVTARYRDWWLKVVSFEAFPARNVVENDDDDDEGSPKVLRLSEVLKKLEGGFPAKRRRTKKGKIVMMSKTSDDGLKSSDHLTNKRSSYKPHVLMKLAREEEESSMDEDDDDMTTAQRKYTDAEKTRGEESTSKPEKTRKICEDEVDVNESNTQKKTITKEAECWLHEDRERQRSDEECSEAINEKEINERLRQRKLAIEELQLKLETRIMKVEKSLAMITNLKNQRELVKCLPR